MKETIVEKEFFKILEAISFCRDKNDGSKTILRSPKLGEIQIFSAKQIKNQTENKINLLQVRDSRNTLYDILPDDCQIIKIETT